MDIDQAKHAKHAKAARVAANDEPADDFEAHRLSAKADVSEVRGRRSAADEGTADETADFEGHVHGMPGRVARVARVAGPDAKA